MNEPDAGVLPSIIRRNLLLAGIIAPLGVFGSLADDIVERERFSFDKPTLLFLQGPDSASKNSVMTVITHAGSGSPQSRAPRPGLPAPAVQEARDGVNVGRMEKVSDEDYLSALAAAAHEH